MYFDRCMGCMEEKRGDKIICPHCGFYQRQDDFLPLETILKGTYVVGRVIKKDMVTISYLGWHLSLSQKVIIKEFYPMDGYVSHLVHRQKIYPPNILVNSNEEFYQEFYRKGLDKFSKEGKKLAEVRKSKGIESVMDCFQENGTAYIVLEFLEGKMLENVIADNGGRVSAGQVFEMMRTPIDSLCEIHKKGVLHNNITPEHVMVDTDGRAVLLDLGGVWDNYFSMEEEMEYIEHIGDDLQPWEDDKVYLIENPKYRLRETGWLSGVQGIDIYALCATMYKTITGVIPEDSIDRCFHDELRLPSDLGILIDRQQEAALMKGLEIDKKNRFVSMEELRDALYL